MRQGFKPLMVIGKAVNLTLEKISNYLEKSVNQKLHILHKGLLNWDMLVFLAWRIN
jgi:hypothetical protein